MDFVDDLLEAETLLSDFDDESDSEGQESGCCLCLFVCPWKPKIFSAQLDGALGILRRRRNVPNYSTRPFDDMPTEGIVKPHYEHYPEVPPYDNYYQADANALVPVGASRQLAGQYWSQTGDTRVLDRFSVRVKPVNLPNVYWWPTRTGIRLEARAKKLKWTMWKNKYNFFCVFGLYKRGKMYYVAWCNGKIKLVKGKDPVGTSTVRNDQRFFRLVGGLGRGVVKLQHVGTAKFMAINHQMYLVLQPNSSQAQNWVLQWA